jgi:hypothetical protein
MLNLTVQENCMLITHQRDSNRKSGQTPSDGKLGRSLIDSRPNFPIRAIPPLTALIRLNLERRMKHFFTRDPDALQDRSLR